MGWLIAGGILTLYITAVNSPKFPQMYERYKIKKDLKKQGYVCTNKTRLKEAIKNVIPGFDAFDDNWDGMTLLPIIHFLALSDEIDDYRKNYDNNILRIKEVLLNEHVLGKSPELLALEADTLITESKYDTVRNNLSSGKLGDYSEMDDISKLKLLKEIETLENEETNPLNILTTEEKIEFLRRERETILSSHTVEIEYGKTKKIGKK